MTQKDWMSEDSFKGMLEYLIYSKKNSPGNIACKLHIRNKTILNMLRCNADNRILHRTQNTLINMFIRVYDKTDQGYKQSVTT
jgi:hypothetical protein